MAGDKHSSRQNLHGKEVYCEGRGVRGEGREKRIRKKGREKQRDGDRER